MPNQKFITQLRELLVMNWKQWPHPPALVLGDNHLKFLISALFLRKFSHYDEIQQSIQDKLQNALWLLWTPSNDPNQEKKLNEVLLEWVNILESDQPVSTLIDKFLPNPRISHQPNEAYSIFSEHSQVISDLLHDAWLQRFLHLSQMLQNLRYSSDVRPFTKDTQKSMGSYYTPPQIILYMLSRLHSEVNTTYAARQQPIRIVDYACGMGAFLFYAAAFLFPNEHTITFLGLDSDPFAIQAAHICKLFLSSHPKFGDIFPSIHFVQKDSLTPLTPEDLTCLETGDKFLSEKNSSHLPAFTEQCLDFSKKML